MHCVSHLTTDLNVVKELTRIKMSSLRVCQLHCKLLTRQNWIKVRISIMNHVPDDENGKQSFAAVFHTSYPAFFSISTVNTSSELVKQT